MKNDLMGNGGNAEGNDGKTKAIIVPLSLCKKIENAIDNEDELVDERTVLQKFRMKKKTLCNYISSKRIPRDYYTIAFNKSRWFFINKLLGLKNFFSGKKVA